MAAARSAVPPLPARAAARSAAWIAFPVVTRGCVGSTEEIQRPGFLERELSSKAFGEPNCLRRVRSGRAAGGRREFPPVGPSAAGKAGFDSQRISKCGDGLRWPIGAEQSAAPSAACTTRRVGAEFGGGGERPPLRLAEVARDRRCSFSRVHRRRAVSGVARQRLPGKMVTRLGISSAVAEERPPPSGGSGSPPRDRELPGAGPVPRSARRGCGVAPRAPARRRAALAGGFSSGIRRS